MISETIGGQARKLEYVARTIKILNNCYTSEENCCFGTETMLPEFRITIPDHLKNEFVVKLLDYYKEECRDTIRKLNNITL